MDVHLTRLIFEFCLQKREDDHWMGREHWQPGCAASRPDCSSQNRRLLWARGDISCFKTNRDQTT